MAQSSSAAEGAERRSSGSDHHPEIDWIAAEQSQEFKELIAKRRSFVLPATIFFFAWYFGFIILAGYAEDFMGREFLFDGVTVGYALALTQFLMVWVLAGWYLRKANRDFDPLEAGGRQLAERGPLPATGGNGARTQASDAALVRDDVAPHPRGVRR